MRPVSCADRTRTGSTAAAMARSRSNTRPERNERARVCNCACVCSCAPADRRASQFYMQYKKMHPPMHTQQHAHTRTHRFTPCTAQVLHMPVAVSPGWPRRRTQKPGVRPMSYEMAFVVLQQQRRISRMPTDEAEATEVSTCISDALTCCTPPDAASYYRECTDPMAQSNGACGCAA